MRQYRRYLLFFIAAGLVLTQGVYAYIDPGVGSMIWQLLVAVSLGVLYTLKVYWIKVKGFFRRMFSHDAHE